MTILNTLKLLTREVRQFETQKSILSDQLSKLKRSNGVRNKKKVEQKEDQLKLELRHFRNFIFILTTP